MKFLMFILIVTSVYSQANKIVKSTFKSTKLINFQTIEQPYKNTMEFVVGHRFGDSYSGVKDFFGLDNGVQTYIGFDFGLTDQIQIGIARLSLNKTYSFNTKIKLLRQQRGSHVPSVSIYGAFDTKTAKFSEEKYWLLQPIIASKFSKSISIQASPFFIQRLEESKRLIGAQDIVGLGLSGRVKLSKRTSFIAELALVFNRDSYNKNSFLNTANTFFDGRKEKNAFSFAYNIEAGGHTFQLVVSNTQEISTIGSLIGTNTDFFGRHMYFGFNMSRLFQL